MSDNKYRYCKLIMVTESNNNKYYEMQETDDNIQVKYGRVDSSCITLTKSLSDWNKLYKNKINKGYKDVTEFVSCSKTDTNNTTNNTTNNILYSSKSYDMFLKLMMEYRDGLVASTYSVKATQVTKKQLQEAQSYINLLAKIDDSYSTSNINDLLLKLYTVIPRNMSKVIDYLVPQISLKELVSKEQDKLDALSSQVVDDNIHEVINSNNKELSIANYLNIDIQQLDETPEDITYITKQLNGSYKGVFKVSNSKHISKYDNYLEANNKGKVKHKHLIHGTRCTSVIPIIEQGLKIRPSGNYHYSGKIYGDGLYFSEVTSKSLGYTGYDRDKVLLIYKVYVGNPYVYNGWFRGNSFDLTYNELSSRGYDSTFVEAGNGLLNSEIIVYKEEQCYLEYIIWL